MANKSSMKGHLIHNLTIPGGKKEKEENTHARFQAHFLKQYKMLFIGWLMLPKSEQTVGH